VARELQDAGAPVVIVQPGAVYGPHDPHLSDQMRRLRDVLQGRYPLWPTGGFHAVDVRDVAAVHAAVLHPGQGPRRLIVPGHRLDGARLFGTLRSVTGRRLPYLPVPAAAALPFAWAASTAQRVLPFRVPLEYEGAMACAYDTRYDDRRARDELGVLPRPLGTTFLDAVRWLHAAGHVTARQAGAAAA
jgi:nucleoside-diphosphate-sugar epimerase